MHAQFYVKITHFNKKSYDYADILLDAWKNIDMQAVYPKGYFAAKEQPCRGYHV